MYNIIIYVMINLEHFLFLLYHGLVYKENIYFLIDYLKPANGGHCASDHKVFTVVC